MRLPTFRTSRGCVSAPTDPRSHSRSDAWPVRSRTGRIHMEEPMVQLTRRSVGLRNLPADREHVQLHGGVGIRLVLLVGQLPQHQLRAAGHPRKLPGDVEPDDHQRRHGLQPVTATPQSRSHGDAAGPATVQQRRRSRATGGPRWSSADRGRGAFEGSHLVASAVFRGVEREVGAADQGSRGVMWPGLGETDAGCLSAGHDAQQAGRDDLGVSQVAVR